MVKNISRVETIVGNMLLEGVAKDCFDEWKKILARYQKTLDLPDTKAKVSKLAKQYSKLVEVSWNFIHLTGNKQSVRDAMIWELSKHDNPPLSNQIELMMGLGSHTIAISEYKKDVELKALRLPMHIVVETNTTIEEIKLFIKEHKSTISELLATKRVVSHDPLYVERDKLIVKLARQGISNEDICSEIDDDGRFTALHGVDGVLPETVSKVIQRKAKYDR